MSKRYRMADGSELTLRALKARLWGRALGFEPGGRVMDSCGALVAVRIDSEADHWIAPSEKTARTE